MSATDSKKIFKLSAYTKVTQKFLDACQEEKVEDVEECLLHILSILNPSSLAQSGPTVSATSASTPRELTKEQVQEAKRLARKEKAERLAVSISEVNLTSEEVKAAKTRFRESLSRGAAPSVKQTKQPSGKGPTESIPQKVNEPSSVQTEKGGTGERSTGKTRVQDARRAVKHASLTAIENPTNLHVLAYWNHFIRLREQWESFKSRFGTDSMSDPYRDVLVPDRHPRLIDFIKQLATEGHIRKQNNSETYVLQNSEGRSFWNKDRPHSEFCPPSLRASVPDWISVLFGDKSNCN